MHLRIRQQMHRVPGTLGESKASAFIRRRERQSTHAGFRPKNTIPARSKHTSALSHKARKISAMNIMFDSLSMVVKMPVSLNSMLSTGNWASLNSGLSLLFIEGGLGGMLLSFRGKTATALLVREALMASSAVLRLDTRREPPLRAVASTIVTHWMLVHNAQQSNRDATKFGGGHANKSRVTYPVKFCIIGGIALIRRIFGHFLLATPLGSDMEELSDEGDKDKSFPAISRTFVIEIDRNGSQGEKNTRFR